MNKKIMVIATTLLTVLMLTAPLIGTAEACRCSSKEKMSIEFHVGGEPLADSYDCLWYTPRGALPPDEGGNATAQHSRGNKWNTTLGGFSITVGEGGAVENITNEYISYSCSYDVDLYYATGQASIRVKETWKIYADTDQTDLRGIIRIYADETLYNLYPFDPATYYGEGYFVGCGVVDGERVEVKGEAGTAIPGGPYRAGTVNGWPPMVEVFLKNPEVDSPDMSYPPIQVLVEGEQSYFRNGTLLIGKGDVREFSYTGPLGTGVLTWETEIAVSHVKGAPVEIAPGVFVNATGTGRGIFKTTLNITDGPYGTGVLRGIMRSYWSYNLTETPPYFIGYPSGTLSHGTGDFRGAKVTLDGINLNFVIWYNTTITIY